MSDAYVVLARRYRSATFDELVGQEPIARTLKNAIKSGRIAHAFLFTGTRGVGKTSAARILAKAINCPDRTPDGNPCGICNSCLSIARGDDLDVIEIDGASNRGIDNIRELRQGAGIRPARSPFKIYIIDEVHMVTRDAFNALLKTLEEPPAHVKFIFATTEVEKVPATILSRCQRFDFKPIPLSAIIAHLQHILEGEKIQADASALHRIARLGAGSMRDALSLLDRVLSLGEQHLTDKTLEELLGRPQEAAVAALVQAVAGNDAAGAITRADELFKEGMGAEQILSELIEFFRSLLIVSACGIQSDILDIPAESRPLYADLAARFDAPGLVHAIALCDQALRSMKSSTMQRPLFDALIVRLALSEQFASVREILSAGPPAHGATPASDADLSKKKSDAGDLSPAPAGDIAPATGDASAQSPPAPPDSPPEPEESIYETMKSHIQKKKDELDQATSRWKPGAANGSPASRPPAIPGRPTANGPASAPVPPTETFTDFSDPAGLWQATRNYLSVHARLLETVLGECARITLINPESREITLTVPASQRNFTNDRAKTKLEEALRTLTAQPFRLLIEFVESDPETDPRKNIGVTGPGHPGAPPAAAAQRIPPELMEAIRNQPLIQELSRRFDGVITQVEILPATGETES